MSKLTPVSWQKLVKVFEAFGFTKCRDNHRHIILAKEGVDRSLVIPKYKDVGVPIIKNNMQTAGMTRQEYFELLKKT